MAVTLYQRTKVINNITIINGKKEISQDEIVDAASVKKSVKQEINAKIRGKMYARRTVNR